MKILGVIFGYITLMVSFVTMLLGASLSPATTVIGGTTFTASEYTTQVSTTLSGTIYTAALTAGQTPANLPMALIGLLGMVGGALLVVIFMRMK